MTADVLCDYVLGRLSSSQREAVQREIVTDRAASRTLRRLARGMKALRERLGRVDHVPREWIALLDGRESGLLPSNAAALARERTKTWL
jgi:anti-sigma factor RsiW